MSTQTAYHPTQEVRIASVMFGGVSLAVYMNGITQELLRAVRATAPRTPGSAEWKFQPERWESRRNLELLLSDDEIASTEAVYRILGRSLFHGRQFGTPLNCDGPIRTRIVVDLLAGTSAGGINSIYLAKALVNNQSLDQLQQMWMEDAELNSLLNDRGSSPGTYDPGPKTTSLLNSTRMYGLLLRAFEGMDLKSRPGSPLADEVDLFVTTTDLNGMALPIQLADRVIEERMHKASFHFVYGPGRFGNPNDFTAAHNPMLAFAARCTSSFPIAFEPMKLEHIDRAIPGLALAIWQDPAHPLRKFFRQFERNHPDLPFLKRPLADGGYLNNKPFSFVIDEVKLRTGTVPVERKLLFLDPFPELNSQVRHTDENINFAQNAIDAASTLPRYQTIREDIERLNEYNRGIHAAQSLAREIEREMFEPAWSYATGPGPSQRPPEEYPKRALSNLVQQFGQCYRTYHRLRVSAVTDELAALVTRLLGHDERSDLFLAVRMLIHSWRMAHYAPESEDGKQLETYFLTQYDMGFRFRRAEYVKGRIDALLAALDTDAALQDQLRTALPESTVGEAIDRLRAAKDEIRRELFRIRDQIVFVKWKLGYERDRLRIGTPPGTVDDSSTRRRTELVDLINATQLSSADLSWILTPVNDDECQHRADILYQSGDRPIFDVGLRPGQSATPSAARPIRQNIERAATILAASLSEILGDVSRRFVAALGRQPVPERGATPVQIIREYVWVHYQFFDCRDMQVFTVVKDQLAGEGSPVEIYRVSPLDAILLRTQSDPGGKEKLAGTALFAFGAFLSENWRQNDMMWGRLDGAERIISALLPDESDGCLRRQLCEKAFHIIINEEFKPATCADLIRPLMSYLRERIDPRGKTAEQFLEEAMRASNENCPEVVRQLLKSVLEDRDRLEVFRAYYVKPADPRVKESLDRLRRAIRIFGDMLADLDSGKGPFTSLGGSLASLGSAFTRFAEFCIPQTLTHAFFRYALQILYATAIVLIIAGAFFYKEVETAGWIVLAVTAAANLAAWMISKWLFRQKTGRRIAGAFVLAALAVALFVFLVIRFPCVFPDGAWKSPVNALLNLASRTCTPATATHP